MLSYCILQYGLPSARIYNVLLTGWRVYRIEANVEFTIHNTGAELYEPLVNAPINAGCAGGVVGSPGVRGAEGKEGNKRRKERRRKNGRERERESQSQKDA